MTNPEFDCLDELMAGLRLAELSKETDMSEPAIPIGSLVQFFPGSEEYAWRYFTQPGPYAAIVTNIVAPENKLNLCVWDRGGKAARILQGVPLVLPHEPVPPTSHCRLLHESPSYRDWSRERRTDGQEHPTEPPMPKVAAVREESPALPNEVGAETFTFRLTPESADALYDKITGWIWEHTDYYENAYLAAKRIMKELFGLEVPSRDRRP